MRNNTILKTVEHIFFIFIAFVSYRFQNLIWFFFPDPTHGRTKHSVICHLVRHFKISDQMCFGIYRCLRIIRNRKTVFIFHKSCIGICQRKLGCSCIFHQFLICFISGKTFLCFFQFLFKCFFC